MEDFYKIRLDIQMKCLREGRWHMEKFGASNVCVYEYTVAEQKEIGRASAQALYGEAFERKIN